MIESISRASEKIFLKNTFTACGKKARQKDYNNLHDIFANNRPNELVKIGNIELPRKIQASYVAGILSSWDSMYEIRTIEYYNQKNFIDGEGRTSGRIMFPVNRCFKWIDWANNNWCRITFTGGEDDYSRATMDLYRIIKEIGFINFDWWNEEDRKNNIIYFNISNDKLKNEYIKKSFKEFIFKTLGKFDEKCFEKYFNKGKRLEPIDAFQINMHSNLLKDKTDNKFKRFIKQKLPNLKLNRTQINILRIYLLRAWKEGGNWNHGNQTIVLIDKNCCNAIKRSDTYSFHINKPNSEYNKKAYNKEDKKKIWKNWNYIIFNKNNNCFSSVDKYYNKIIFINKLWNSLFNDLNVVVEYKKWMKEERITKKQIKNIELQTNVNIDGKYYNQGVEFHHLLTVDFQEANAIIFPINHAKIGIPLFKKDHMKLNNKNIKQQIEIMEKNNWFDSESDDCRRKDKYKFKEYLINSIINIEKEYSIHNNFSTYIKEQLINI
ncbi:hypothetical protein K9M42_02965 [Patescibacteria group bacterium]|nr:hypothetical protein [Patescibacteria group bacterium]